MSQPSEKITKLLILFIIAVVVIKNVNESGFFDPTSHKGQGYYVKFPKGWKKVKERKDAITPQGVERIILVPKEIDLEAGPPNIFISMYSTKLTAPIWIEDEFPDILSSLKKAGYQIMDKGEIKLDEKITKWVVYHDKKTPALVLEFYIVSDNNLFFKMRYSAHPDIFNQKRPAFEEFKNSFKFRFSLF